MNLKAKSDAELNEACARIVGRKPTGLCRASDGPQHHWMKCRKLYDLGYGLPYHCGCLEDDFGKDAIPEEKCTLFEWSELLDYCNSAEAQAGLKRWYIKGHTMLKVMYYSGWENGRWEVTMRLFSGEELVCAFAATEGRALAEAFVMAFGKETYEEVSSEI